MLIINADDFGKDTVTTDNIVQCFRNNRITSTSAMVFMKDSERAASTGVEDNLEVGLHLNFDEQLTGSVPAGPMKEYHDRVATFLTRSKFSQVIYNPLLTRQFDYLYKSQYEEFLRLYRRPPTHINGHHHMHLCTNMLFDKIIPSGFRVRRSFTFMKGERNIANRLYRRIVDTLVMQRFITTDMFFAAIPSESVSVLKRKAGLAKSRTVELMLHVPSQVGLDYVMHPGFMEAIKEASLGTYSDLPDRTLPWMEGRG